MKPLTLLAVFGCAVCNGGIAKAQGMNPSSDWSAVRRAVWAQAVIASDGQRNRNARILAVDDSSVTFEDLDRGPGVQFMMLRPEVSQVSKWTGFNGSIRGAVLGSVGGLAVGYLLAKQVQRAIPKCATSCQVENAVVYTVLFTPPIVGGVLGYRKLPGNRRLIVIYVKA